MGTDMYGVEMYISKKSMNACIYDDKCLESRLVDFGWFARNEFSYLLISNSRKLTAFACIYFSGAEKYANKGCHGK